MWVARTKQPSTLEIALGAAAGVVVGLIVVGVVLLAWKCSRAAFVQRTEARDEVEHLRRVLYPDFPSHALRIRRLSQLILPDNNRDAGKRILFLPIEFTNRDPARKVSLDFEVVSVYRGLGQLTLQHYRHHNLREVFPSPLAVDPATHVKGQLCLDGDYDWLFEPSDPDSLYVTIKPNTEFTLCVTDHVSGVVIECPIPREGEEVCEG